LVKVFYGQVRNAQFLAGSRLTYEPSGQACTSMMQVVASGTTGALLLGAMPVFAAVLGTT